LRSDETFYGFAEPAFALEPDVRFLYHSTEHDRVAQQLVEGIARREGVIVLTAPTGMGKTLLCKALVEGQGAQIDRRTLTSVLLTPPPSVDDLVRTLLVDFGVVSRDDLAARTGEGGDPTEPLRAFLSSLAALQANAVVVFDEAQNAGSDVLLAVHALAAALPRTLQIVLVGQPALTRLLGRPELRAMLEHVALRLHVGPLAADEVAGYVLHRVHLAAASPRVEFDDGAMDRLYALSLGVPRIVNQICDRALTRAFAASATTIDGELVADAAEDLGLEMPAGPRDALRRVALLLAFVLLMGVGGSTAAWVFRDRVHAILATWNVTP
jgi:general secretion pathway protein A